MTAAETKRSQDERQIAIATPGDTNLLFIAMHGNETLGRMFHFELELMREGSPLDNFNDILGQNVTIRVDKYNSETRYINGYISRFMFAGAEDDDNKEKKLYMYRATMVPWTWFLTRCSDCRIFQEKTVPEIIQQIFKDRGLTDFKLDLHGQHRKWDYCVQYRETDFNFISRLMEQEGIYYYYEHDDGKHTMILVDSGDSHKAAEKYESLSAKPATTSDERDDFIWEWTFGQEITPTKYAITDYNFEQPKTNLLKSDKVKHDHDPCPYEIFDFPGGYTVGDDGKNYVATRMKEVEAQYAVGHATSGARGIYPGCLFKLIDQPEFPDKEYLITSMGYQAKSDTMGAELGRGGGGGSSFICQITCIPKDTQFRSPRVTPKPLVQGPQTAVIVGPSGEEIYTDKYGRVKLKFHWDRETAMDETASCWVRVSQPMAGKGFGMIQIPRIGQEVVVEFLEGDPDRPIVTGRVFNGDNMPPYALPGAATQLVLKTSSSKGGGNFNEIRLEDKKDSEQMYFFAGKNMDLRVKNDRYETVENDMHVTISNDSYLTIGNNYHVQVASDYMVEVQANSHLTIASNDNQDVGSNRSVNIGGNLDEAVGGNTSLHTAGNFSLKADGDLIIEAGGSITVKVGGHSISIGSDGIKIKTSGDLTTEASGASQHKAGSQYKIESGGQVKVTGTAVKVQASGMLDLSAGGIMKAQGSVIKLN